MASAYLELRTRILRCELAPGASVTEAQVVELLGIGKTPVREALARLVHEGLVKNVPRHGYVVSPITLKYVHELYGLRLINEPTAVGMAAGRIDPAREQRLAELCEIHYAPEDSRSVAEFLRLNREFHVLVAEACGNDRLAELVGRLLDESDRISYLSLTMRNRGELIAHSHRELLDVLLSGDAARARQLAAEQIANTQRRVVEALLWSPSIRDVPLDTPLPSRVSA
jgi:DNA-binding GntR family transcriptional regulator